MTGPRHRGSACRSKRRQHVLCIHEQTRTRESRYIASRKVTDLLRRTSSSSSGRRECLHVVSTQSGASDLAWTPRKKERKVSMHARNPPFKQFLNVTYSGSGKKGPSPNHRQSASVPGQGSYDPGKLNEAAAANGLELGRQVRTHPSTPPTANR